jgi:hypothetical protein
MRERVGELEPRGVEWIGGAKAVEALRTGVKTRRFVDLFHTPSIVVHCCVHCCVVDATLPIALSTTTYS